MTLAEHLTEDRIMIGLEAATKRDYIRALASVMANAAGTATEDILEPLVAREKLGSTAIGKGVALPHAKSARVSVPIAAVAVLAKPIEAAAPDDVSVDVVVAVILPAADAELLILSQIVKDLRDERLLAEVKAVKTPADFLAALARAHD